MPWFRVDDKLWGHPKWVGCSPRARALWITAGSWSADQLTDGRIPSHLLAILGGTKREADELVRVALWKSSEDGWEFHDWSDFQPTAEQVRSERAAAKERQRKARDAARKRREAQQTSPDVTPDVTDMSRRDSQRDSTVSHGPPDPTRPDPTRSSYGTTPPAEGSAPKRAHQLPADFEPNDTNRRIAKERGIDLPSVVAQFSDFHRAKGNTMKDWHLALNTWLRRERPGPAAQAEPKRSVPEDYETAPTGMTDEQWAEWDDDRRRRADEHRARLAS